MARRYAVARVGRMRRAASGGQRQRVEQCGDRLLVTAGGIIRDMRCDGTKEHRINDVAQIDYSTPIVVMASCHNGSTFCDR